LEIDAIKTGSVLLNENRQLNRQSFLLTGNGKEDTFECSKALKKENKTGKFNSFINRLLKYNTECSDGSDDGKLSFKEATVSFLRGTLNTVTNIIDAVVEHPVASVLSVAGTVALTAGLTAAGIVSAPVIAIAGSAVGIGIGAFNLGKGIYNASKADNDADAKKAFEKMGEGTSTAAVSALSMKKGISEFKEIKKLASSASDMAKTASQYADDAAETCARAETSFDNASKAAGKAASNAKEGDRILSDTIKLADDAGSNKFELDLKRAQVSAEKISQSDSLSQQALKDAEEALKNVKKAAAEASKSADDAKLFADKTAKAATLKRAKQNYKMTSDSLQNAQKASETASVNASVVENNSKNIANLAAETESEIKNICKSFINIDEAVSGTNYSYSEYTDDRVFGYDFSDSASRNECRTHMDMNAGMADDQIKVVSLDEGITQQLSNESKYSELGRPRVNKRDGKSVFICENLKDAPDMNGVRGKTPLAGKKGVVNWKLREAKKSGIKTVIDLRAEGECSSAAREVLKQQDLKYVNFPVEDSAWTKESLPKISEFISAINEGDFYVGCANGESRTDLAIALNYVFNPNAKSVPNLYFGTATSSRVSIKMNIKQILELVKANNDIVKDWGWESYSDFCFGSRKKI